MTTSEGSRFSPLTYAAGSFVAPGTGGWIGKVLYPETAVVGLVAKVAPEQAFAAGAWLMFVIAAIMLPVWLTLIGVRAAVSIPCTILVLLAPTTAWWSWSPTAVVGIPAMTAVLTIVGTRLWVDHRRFGATLVGFAAALSFARVALGYQPWGIPMALMMFVPTLAYLIESTGRRRVAFGVVGAITVLGGLISSAYLRQEAKSFGVLLDTVYPGGRRSVGEALDMAHLFGAPHLWVLQKADAALVNTNQSEIASGYLVLGLVALMLVPAVQWSRVYTRRATAASSLVVLAGLATWCTVAWPSGASRLFPLSIIPAARMGQILGIAATLSFAIMFDRWSRQQIVNRWPAALSSAALAAFVTAMGGSALRINFLPSYRTTSIAWVTIIVAVVVLVAVLSARRWWTLVPLAVVSIFVVASVNPLQRGFGDLSGSTTAQQIRDLGSELDTNEAWAADDFYMDAYLMANGQLSLSGQQWVGPNKKAWKRLDPDEAAKDTWNRGASFIQFDWVGTDDPPSIQLQQADVIRVVANPCDPALEDLGLRLVSSDVPLDMPCLTEKTRLHFGNAERVVYQVGDSA